MVIGLDGGTLELIQPWVNQGKLPNIAHLMRTGVYADLQSTLPPMTFPAWNAFMTGKNPGKHGVYDFMERKGGAYELEIKNARHRKSDTIWNIASTYGKRCAIVGVPVTYPPEEINGIMISGFDAPVVNEDIMFPSSLFQELQQTVGEYIVTANFSKFLKVGRIDKALEALFSAIDRKAETAKYLLKRELWDLFMFVFGETDVAIHYFWKYHDEHSPQRGKSLRSNKGMDPIYEIYNRIDEHIGAFIELAPEDTTFIIMSDHGAGGVGKKVVYLNRFLETHGLLKFCSNPVRVKINRHMDSIKDFIRLMLSAKVVKHLRFNPKGMGLKWESKMRFSCIDWRQTKAYAEETPYYPNVRINLKGREPDGIVEKSDYHELVMRILSLLDNWRDPETGEKIIEKAHKREDLYNGVYIDKAPDIIISWNYNNGYSYIFRPSFTSKTKNPLESMTLREIEKSDFMLNRTGSHRDEGVLIMTGNKIHTNARLSKPHIMDLAPTILFLLGIPIPFDMDGKVLTECLTEVPGDMPTFEDRDVSTQKSEYHYSEEETEEIKKKLEGLGYLN
jgi:predicted AlkP superfamily phosphohydrolase/phosphomutase